MEIITQIICKKNNISYITFNKTFEIMEFNESIKSVLANSAKLKISCDVRDFMWELIGLEEELSRLYNDDDKDSIHFPMIIKDDDYYDLDIETFNSQTGEKLFIAYIIRKSKESLSYINMIKEINKKTLIYESQNRDKQVQEFSLINSRLLSFNVDMDGIITSINSVFLHFFDLTQTEIIGKHFSQYFQARDLNLNNSSTIIFNAVNNQDEIISFHADIIPNTLNNAIVENIIICQDVSYLKQIEKELEFAAGHDALTGLANRSKLLKKLDEVIQDIQNTNTSFSVCFIDLDKFKPINDNYGHHAGDMLLKHIAKVLSDFVRKGDMVARIGGDEFIILYDTLTEMECLQTIQKRIKELPKKHPFIYSEEDIIEYGFSLGLASYPKDALNAQDLIQFADKAKRKKLF